MKIRNWLDTVFSEERQPERYHCNCGDSYVEEKVPHLNEDGTITLEVVGKTNLEDYIQSFADSCNINLIIQRYKNGDITALNQRVGVYFDCSNAPESLAEALNTVIAGEKMFDELSTDVKKKFDNNYYRFISEIGSDHFMDVLGLNKMQNPVEDPAEEKVGDE